MSGPLAGIRVVDLTSAVLGPVATQILGDMGADVIKVEPPEGDSIRPLGPSRHPGMGAYFLNINRNKKSVALDLKRSAAREALLKLVETADVFVHNMRLAAAERLGLDYQAVAGRNPRIVYAAAAGFRKDGVHRDRPSFDDVIQGESGLAALNGGPGGEPRYVPMAVCDKICGYVLASAIGMALFHRERTGEGQEVHVPMLETMVAFNFVDHLWYGVLAEPEKGLGYPRMLTEHRRPFPTKDGHICILATTDLQSRHLSKRLIAHNWPMISASRPRRVAPTISANSMKSSSSVCAGVPQLNGASGSTVSMSRTVSSPASKAYSPTPISTMPGFLNGSSIPPKGRC